MKRVTMLALVLAGGLVGGSNGHDPVFAEDKVEADVEMSKISGPADEPRRHFRLRNPADLSGAQAEAIYAIAKASLAIGYARSSVRASADYPKWRRYNTEPYLSATHGNHYINNYANDAARRYGQFEKAGKLPVGSVIAKDSFSVTETGGILLGPLFLMEKMPAGFSYVSGDWKYTMVLPDGTLMGETNGRGSERVQYCIGCHLAVEHQDHLYFMPERVRRRRND